METQLENVVETQEEVVVSKKKKPNKVVAIIVALVCLGLFIGLQFVVVNVAGMVTAVSLANQYLPDVEMYNTKFEEYIGSNDFITISTVLSEIAATVVFGLWYFFGYVRKTSKEEKKEIYSKVFTAKTIATATLLGLGCYGAACIVANIVAVVNPHAEEIFNQLMGVMDYTNPWIVLSIVVFAPISEELAFRGIIFHKLNRTFPVWFSIVGSALLFAIAHMNPMQSFYTIPIAIIMGYVCYKYKSILPTIIIHFVNNGLSVISDYVHIDLLENYFAYALYLIIGFSLAIMLNKEVFAKKTEN